MDSVDGIRYFREKFMTSSYPDLKKKDGKITCLLFLKVHEIGFPAESDI